MTPGQVLQSLEAQRTALIEQIDRLPAGSSQRQVAEDSLRQQDFQLARVKQEYRRQGEQV